MSSVQHTTIDHLLSLKEIRDYIFSFVGRGHYRYVAGVNQSFRDTYKAFVHYEEQLDGRSPTCRTTWESSTESVDRTRLRLQEEGRSEKLCTSAAFCGRLDILEWARNNGCPWDEDTCSVAASNGHLEVLKWARTNECPWDASACTEAANSGRLEVLEWAKANGCPYHDLTMCSCCRHQ